MKVYQAAIKRRSIRRFKNRAVPREVLEKCIDAARLAPSAANLQPLEYIVISDEELLPQVFSTLKWAAYISPAGDPPVGKRPTAYVVMLKVADTSVAASVYDVGAAMENILLVALEEGIGSCPFASVDRNTLRKILNVPDNYEITLVLALGYPDEAPVTEPFVGSVKYAKDEKGILHVPKRELGTILHREVF